MNIKELYENVELHHNEHAVRRLYSEILQEHENIDKELADQMACDVSLSDILAEYGDVIDKDNHDLRDWLYDNT